MDSLSQGSEHEELVNQEHQWVGDDKRDRVVVLEGANSSDLHRVSAMLNPHDDHE